MQKALLVIVGVLEGLLAPGVARVKFAGKAVGGLDDREVWSTAASTIDRCTRALGRAALGEDGWSASTTKRR